MIYLDDTLLVGRGTLRACYRHPGNDDLVVKVPLKDSSGGRDANDKEMRSYRSLRRKHAVLEHISHCHGLIPTDRGKGLVCDCIRDHDGV